MIPPPVNFVTLKRVKGWPLRGDGKRAPEMRVRSIKPFNTSSHTFLIFIHLVMKENTLKESYGTLSQTINALAKAGYSHDFNLQNDCIICHAVQLTLSPDDFQIDKVYRFEGDADPEYQSILYAISSPKHGVKGTLVNGYGIYADEISSKMIEKLNPHTENHHTVVKANDATPQRPKGDRILDASQVEIHLPQYLHQLKSETAWVNSDRNSITVFKSDVMRIVLIGLKQNAELKPHRAPGIISVQVLEGDIEFTAQEQHTRLLPGQMIVLHENIIHQVRAMKESCFLLTVSMKSAPRP